MTDFANAETVRAIVEPTAKAAASAAIREFVQTHPHWQSPPPKAEIPAPLKWAGIIISSLFTVGVSAACIWAVSTLNDLQLTVARMDERQRHDMTGKEIEELKTRVTTLENYHRAQPGGK